MYKECMVQRTEQRKKTKKKTFRQLRSSFIHVKLKRESSRLSLLSLSVERAKNVYLTTIARDSCRVWISFHFPTLFPCEWIVMRIAPTCNSAEYERDVILIKRFWFHSRHIVASVLTSRARNFIFAGTSCLTWPYDDDVFISFVTVWCASYDVC